MLLALIVMVNAYTIAAPLAPALSFWWRSRDGSAERKLQEKVAAQDTPLPQNLGPNKVTIPSMLLDAEIYEGPVQDMYKVLDKGIWRWPAGSTPDKGSNTVLLGHRFTYTNPNGVLYHLDKVRIGDTIGLVWNNKKYTYKVVSTVTVPPSATQVVAPTELPKLTIYTCAPLWSPKNRLVVTASLESKI